MISPIADLLLARTPHSADVELFGRFVGQWLGEHSKDGGATFRVAEEMRMSRV